MAYIPFIYFTLLLLWHINRRDMRFGAGAMSLLCVDVSAFFSIILDARNLYGDFGCNPFAITIGGVLLYCALWTVVLYPIMRLDKKDIRMEVIKPELLNLLCIVVIICVLFYVIATGAIGLIQEKLTTSRVEAYSASMDNSNIYHSQRLFWLWIPMIFANASPLCLLLWFISITISPTPLWIRTGLLISSLFLVLSAYAGGGRAQLIWFIEMFAIYYCYFSQEIPQKRKVNVLTAGIIIAVVLFIGLLAITVSRFDSNAPDYALNSFIGYAGQNLNNFCACLPYVDMGHIYGERMLPLTTFLRTGQPYDMFEYYSFLSQHYPMQVNVFFTMFGGALMDMGVIGLCVYLCLYLFIVKRYALPKNQVLSLPKILMFAMVVCVPVRGLYGYPFTTTNGTLFLLTIFALYFVFRYTFKYDKHKII